jgi:hypothetical protein
VGRVGPAVVGVLLDGPLLVATWLPGPLLPLPPPTVVRATTRATTTASTSPWDSLDAASARRSTQLRYSFIS